VLFCHSPSYSFRTPHTPYRKGEGREASIHLLQTLQGKPCGGCALCHASCNRHQWTTQLTCRIRKSDATLLSDTTLGICRIGSVCHFSAQPWLSILQLRTVHVIADSLFKSLFPSPFSSFQLSPVNWNLASSQLASGDVLCFSSLPPLFCLFFPFFFLASFIPTPEAHDWWHVVPLPACRVIDVLSNAFLLLFILPGFVGVTMSEVARDALPSPCPISNLIFVRYVSDPYATAGLMQEAKIYRHLFFTSCRNLSVGGFSSPSCSEFHALSLSNNLGFFSPSLTPQYPVVTGSDFFLSLTFISELSRSRKEMGQISFVDQYSTPFSWLGHSSVFSPTPVSLHTAAAAAVHPSRGLAMISGLPYISFRYYQACLPPAGVFEADGDQALAPQQAIFYAGSPFGYSYTRGSLKKSRCQGFSVGRFETGTLPSPIAPPKVAQKGLVHEIAGRAVLAPPLASESQEVVLPCLHQVAAPSEIRMAAEEVRRFPVYAGHGQDLHVAASEASREGERSRVAGFACIQDERFPTLLLHAVAAESVQGRVLL
jgi:hypothetical protein